MTWIGSGALTADVPNDLAGRERGLATEMLTAGLGSLQACGDPLLDQAAFEPREGGEDVGSLNNHVWLTC